MKRRSLFLAALLAACATTDARANVKLNSLFSDHAVLQSGVPVPVWGKADPGEEVTVTIAGQSATAKADEAGKWKVTLEKLSATKDPQTLIAKGKNTITVKDILVGETWLCSGQSNMGMRVSGALNFEDEKKNANLPQIRMYIEPSQGSATPQEEGRGAWYVCSPETVGTFSATAYFFGRELHQKLNIPVGLINSSVGGTRIEAWISAEAQQKEPALKEFITQNDATRTAFDAAAEKTRFDAEMARFNEGVKRAKAEGKPLPTRKPRDPVASHERATVLGNLFNGKIAPLVPYAIRGVIWYQGESNASPQLARFYKTQLPLLIKDWRTRWNQPDLPFGFVQLPNIQRSPSWVDVREAQDKTLKNVPHTGMAVTIDVGEVRDVHPHNKQAVGKRLAAWALSDVYKVKDVVPSGPRLAGHEVKDAKVTLTFTHTEGGLKAKAGQLESFQIAGADRKWHTADAALVKNTVELSSPEVTQPVAVRYAWTDNPNTSLYNGAGLPAAPFRTDDWKQELSLPAIFSDHMVLQAEAIIPVWGWAVPYEDVTATFNGVSKTIKADVSGKWMIRLGKFKASAKPSEFVVKTATKAITLKDVLVGEVWLASGQSNMAYMFSRGQYPEEERQAAALPELRMFTVKQNSQRALQADCEGSWVVASPDAVGAFSAVAYFFGRELHLALKQPVGMINSSWGGTDIAAWTSEDAQAKVPALKAKLNQWATDELIYDADAVYARWLKADEAWKVKVKDAKLTAVKPPARPKLNKQPERDQNHPANLYNGMIAPLLPYAIKGAIWYQGEHNCSGLEKATLYKTQLPLLVNDWRARFGIPEMPFAWVQLPNFEHVGYRPLVREAMLESLKVKNTGMAITVDIGEAKDNHPRNKQGVGQRLSYWALGTVYKKDVPATSGPLFQGGEVQNGKMVITFDHTNGGLAAKDGPLKGFLIAGKDKVWKPATAVIEGDKVIASSPDTPSPVAVRYAWEASPVCNLYNGAGLPASPFRTDTWPLEDIFAPKPPAAVDLSKDTARQVVIAQGTAEEYQGHPTTVLLPDGKTMYCVWTYKHGGNCGPLKRSDDGGNTWSDLLPVPESWKTLKNCPSIYRLTDPKGKARLFVFAGQGPDGTMHQSVSEDDGKTWSPMVSNKLVCVMPFCTIIPVEGGKKLIGLTNIRRPGETKDTKSNILTQSISEDGGFTWSPWRIILDMGDLKPCEPYLVRSPDGKQLLCLIRENKERVALSMVSNNEGKTWSPAKPLPAGLHGDRHMAHYAEDGRLVVCFRDTGLKSSTKTHFVAWVGKYEDIISGRDGQYRLKLLHSYKGGDCGYPGLELLPDGTFVATTYIKYREGPEQNSVVSVRFNLQETDKLAKERR
ncbi:BNR repeat protein [Roseimicrobium gellanilyticum]|uniref:BNR repeat protein n=1 Tax=Roseimicrobium gellanilyticum TaxID=748857 RepID=A0A366HEK2_9BACT|nr:sialate O-acetylesterase [Roseimicrobium gellanilyticum]RBP40480.1 BNR repeat protein [Roseimicrobium gellanilyticum]